MKIRLICRFCYQVSIDAFNTAYRTFDIPLPEELEQDSNILELIKNNLMGAEVIGVDDSDKGECPDISEDTPF